MSKKELKTKEQLAEIAEHIFGTNPKIKELHLTSDGQAFTNENAAINQSKVVGDGEVESFKKAIEAEEEATGESLLDLSVPKLKEELKKIDSVEQLNQLLEGENAKEEPRSTAIKAIEDRLEDIAKDQEVEE